MATLKVIEAKIRKKDADTTKLLVEKMRNSAREKNKIPAERLGWRRELG